MISIYKSFFYGMCFASLTWAISLFLYYQLLVETNIENSNNNNNTTTTTTTINKLEDSLNNKEIFDGLGMIMNLEDEKLKDEGYKNYAFNVLISQRIDYKRDLPDTRNKLCKDIKYPEDLPTASVIVCFYNEHFNTLMRTVHSIINRTPSKILKEIILVDDFSNIADLHLKIIEEIDKGNNNVKSKVKIFKTERREGLIRARLFGSRRAKGEVIVFLDSHVEVNVDWIEPLLNRIKEDRETVVTPIIDIINADTFKYTASPLVRGGFNWGLHFKWENLPIGTLSKAEDFTKPIKSPTMAGGLFAINREYFIQLGEYDEGMNIWGGENLEISFRIWMCGGKLEMIPCSRVGHVFRQRRPYGDPNGQDTMLYNSLRLAHVWMDDYKQHFFDQRVEAKKAKYGDVSGRIRLRKELNCKNFDWYVKNVYPELTLPTDDKERLKKKWAKIGQDVYQPWHSRKRNYTGNFQIRLTNTTLCLQSKKDLKAKGSHLTLKYCLRNKQQMWYETNRKELVLGQFLCLQAASPRPILYKCHEMGGDQEWRHTGMKNSPIYNMAAGTCLSAEGTEPGVDVFLKICKDRYSSTWDLVI